MLIAFLIVFIFMCALIFNKKRKNNIINPCAWLFVAWLLIFGLYYFSGIKYFYKVEYTTYLFIALSGIMFFGFFAFGFFLKTKREISIFNLKDDIYFNKKKYLYISLFGLLLYVFDVSRLNIFAIGMRNLNMNVSLIGTIGSFMAYSALFLWLYELVDIFEKNKKLKISSFFPLFIYLIPNIIVGGRQAFMIATISSMCIYIYLSRKKTKYINKKKIVFIMLILLTLFIIYNAIIIQNRSTYTDMNKHYEVSFGSIISQNTLNLIGKTGIFQEQALAFIYYYSHEIPSFAVILQEYDYPPLLGMFELNYISRRLPASLGLDYMLGNNEIERISFSIGTRATLYRTLLRDFIIDFGKIGAVNVSAIVGFMFGRSFKKFTKQQSRYRLVLQSMLCAAAVFSIQYSPIYEIRWAFPFYWMLLIPVIETIAFNKSHANNLVKLSLTNEK